MDPNFSRQRGVSRAAPKTVNVAHAFMMLT